MRTGLASLSGLLLACSTPAPSGDDGGGQLDAGKPITPDGGRAADAAVPDEPLTMRECFERMFPGTEPELDYDQFQPMIGSHCAGTNHQDITGVERVVFLGDSITVGTPPTSASQVYRAQLAQALATRFGLEPPSGLWNTANPSTGEALVAESGDFAVCARWGARADDLMQDDDQIARCIPEAQRHKRHLVIMTVGGNDIAAITQEGADGAASEDLWATTQSFVGLTRSAVEWLVEPGRFPNGVHVVFTNMYEFTDATGDTDACPAAAAAGYGAWSDPQALRDMVIWANEQYVSIAVDTGTDVVFALEQFCGHGFRSDDESSPCFRGQGTPRWLDDTCIHPNPTGHGALSGLFEQVIGE